jgi:ETC complex I subunit conserved region
MPSEVSADVAAVIYKPARSAMTSGEAESRGWKLRFEPRSARVIEPLMGWTANDDTLAQVELAFPSVAAAVAYARRQGLNYVVRDLANVGANVPQIGDGKRADAARSQAAVQEGNDPSGRYASPRDVLRDRSLSEDERRSVLQRWALDAYLIELALSKGDAAPGASRLDEVIDALIDLEEPEIRRIAARAPRSAGLVIRDRRGDSEVTGPSSGLQTANSAP